MHQGSSGSRRIKADEVELEMPVVLEEFGSKLDKRCAPRRARHAGGARAGVHVVRSLCAEQFN